MPIKSHSNGLLYIAGLAGLSAILAAGVPFFLNGVFDVKRDSYVLVVLPILFIDIALWTTTRGLGPAKIPVFSKPSTLFLLLFFLLCRARIGITVFARGCWSPARLLRVIE